MASDDKDRAKRADPGPFLASRGYEVRWSGRHGSITKGGAEVYRITLRDDGEYVFCSHQGGDGGDNITLARTIDPGLGFREAVAAVLGTATPVSGASRPEGRPRTRPGSKAGQTLIFPPSADFEGGRGYLVDGRGIDPQVLVEAEHSGAVRYASGKVGFCGYDGSGSLRSVMFRATSPLTPADAKKWNMIGSDLRYPPIFRGFGDEVWIVEGGVDALAVQSLRSWRGAAAPTVIVSGGVRARAYLGNPAVAGLIGGARMVWLARDREKDEATQAGADKAFSRTLEVVGVLATTGVRVWEPPEGVKDVADHLLRVVRQDNNRPRP
jgi:hypothetical protein